MFDMKKRRIQLASSKHQQEGGREYLCCHETLPQQMLNVYGPGKWGHLNEQPFWYHLNQSLPTVAKRITELCFKMTPPGYATLQSELVVKAAGPRRKVYTTGLSKHAKVLYDWVKPGGVSYVRMLLHWQAGGGASYVASTHHRVVKAFITVGNSMRGSISEGVSLEEFQNAIMARHNEGGSGIELSQNSQNH